GGEGGGTHCSGVESGREEEEEEGRTVLVFSQGARRKRDALYWSSVRERGGGGGTHCPGLQSVIIRKSLYFSRSAPPLSCWLLVSCSPQALDEDRERGRERDRDLNCSPGSGRGGAAEAQRERERERESEREREKERERERLKERVDVMMCLSPFLILSSLCMCMLVCA